MSLDEDRELDATVLGPAGFGLVGVDRLVTAGAAHLEAFGVDAGLHEIVADGLGAARADRGRLGGVGVAGDLDAHALELLELGDRPVEHRPRLRPDRGALRVEVDALQAAVLAGPA